jgi:glycosyltransferase involved in cell wall biosynthesis
MTLRELRQRLLVRSQLIIVRANLASMLPAPARHLLQGRTLHHVAGASSLPVASLEPSEREDLRRRYLDGQRRLVVFFGFIYPNKGVEHLFRARRSIDRPDRRRRANGGWIRAYRNRLETLAQGKWSGKATFTGFLTPEQAAMLLAVADAVVLPFREGGGDWNSSILGATANGAYVITTSKERRGYDEGRNIAFTAIDDVAEMRKALALSETRGARAGRSPGRPAAIGVGRSRRSHLDVYRRAWKRKRTIRHLPSCRRDR